MQNNHITDSQKTVSSNSSWSAAYNGRLGQEGKSWCTDETLAEFLQVDLLQIHTVTYIATQGSPIRDAWVTSYFIEYSADGLQWFQYKEADGMQRVR